MTPAQLALPDAPRSEWKPPEPTDLDQAAVLAVLRDGSRHLRDELARLTLLPDRSVRAAIEALRRAGWPICSSSDSRGYVLSWRREDLDRLERDLGSRALAALRTRSAIRRSRRQRVA